MSQAAKLKAAYENMVRYEANREQEKKNRDEMRMAVKKQKNRDMAMKFQQAENIRAEERQLKQARFFHTQLKQMVKDENKEKNLM